jgi:hypothetical protein
LGISLLILVSLTVLPASNQITDGFAAYYTASRLVREHRGGSIFYDDHSFQAEVESVTAGQSTDIYWANPPTTALMFMPLGALSIRNARLMWTLLSLLSLFLAVIISGLVIFNTPFQTKEFYIAASVLFVSAPTAKNFQFGQAYLFLLTIYMIALLAVCSGRDWLAGFFLAFAIALKASGLPLLVLLALRGNWRLTFWTFITLTLLVFLSVRLVGLSTWWNYLFIVIPKFITDPVVAVTAYQTVPGFLRHLFTYDAAWNPDPIADWPAFASLGNLLITLLLMTIAILPSKQASFEWIFCVGLILSVILVPAAEQHHYVLLFPSVLLAVRSPNIQKWLLYIAAALIALPLNFMNSALSSGWWALFAYPRLYGAVILFFMLQHLQTSPASYEAQVINSDGLAGTQ